MKIRTVLLIATIMVTSQSCINSQGASVKNDKQNPEVVTTIDSTIYDHDVKHTDPGALEFRDVFNFKYKDGDASGQVSIYHDAVNQLVMYYPEDEMTQFIIIDKDAEVYFFYHGEHGDNFIQREKLTFTPDGYDTSYPLSTEYAVVEKLDDTFSVDQSSFSLPTINFQGYHLNYVQYNDGLYFYITDAMNINSEQLHAFGQLINLDWNYPLPLGDLSQRISHDQFIGKVVGSDFEMEFMHYTPTTIWAQISDYKYMVENENGDFIEEEIPLMQFVKE